MTRRQRRDDWDKFVKTLERDITGTQSEALKYLNSYNCTKEINSKLTRYQKRNGKNTMENFGMSKIAKVKKEQKRRGEAKGQTTTET